LIVDSPFIFLAIFSVIFVITFSFSIKILEGPVQNTYLTTLNCIWNILVTMTTIGYGDMYPITVLGKIVIILTSIFGCVVTNLLTVSLENLFNMENHEVNAYNDFTLSLISDKIDKKGGMFFLKGMIYNLKKKKYNNEASKIDDSKKKEKFLNKYNYDKQYYQKLQVQNEFKNIKAFYKNTYETLSENDLLINSIAVFQSSLNYMYENNSSINNSLKNIERLLKKKKKKNKKKIKV